MNRNGIKLLVSTAAVFTALVCSSFAQTTNWAAYNDHMRPDFLSPTPPPPGQWGNALRVTTYVMGAAGDTTGAPLTNFLTGEQLAATMSVFRTGEPDNFGTVVPPSAGTPAHRLFFGKCDLAQQGIVGVDAAVGGGTIDYVTLTFNNLNPDKRYLFRGTSGRGGNYSLRWAVAQILAESFIDAHESGTGSPGVLTSNNYPAFLSAGQAAWNSGDNVEGDVVGWDFIDPYADGSFSLVVSQYVGMTPVGLAADVNYGYSFGAIFLAEIEATAVAIQTDPPAQTTVEQNRSFSLGVTATGSPLLYQWYKEGTGAIPGATFPTYSKSRAELSDSGNYYVVVYNPINTRTSSVTQLTVNPDVSPPGVDIAFSYGGFDTNSLALSLNQVIVDFNEIIDGTSAGNPLQYNVSTVGNPSSVTVTGERTVLLELPSALAEDTDYTVQISGVRDLAGNPMVAASTPFRSWMRSPGNGAQFEAFATGPGVEVSILRNSPNFPNNPFLRSNIWAMDTRVVYPDNTVEGYGGRLRGVFIPPVSGDWLFYFRTYGRGEVLLNPNGMNPAGAVRILEEQTGNDPRNWNKFISSPQSLRAGRGYYIEALYQAGAGQDVIKVAARLLGTGTPLPNDTPNTEVDTNSLHGAAIAAPLAPRDFGGVISIVQQPANQTVEDNNLASFSVQVNNPSQLPLYYQWFRDGVAIPGAFDATYSFYVTPADDQAKFKVEIAKIGASLTSSEATLTVVPDVTLPYVVQVTSPSANTSNIVIRFSERVQQGPAQDPFNYGFLDAPVLSYTLDPDGRTVTAVLDAALTPGNTYSIEISGIPDISGLVMDLTNVTFVAAGDLPQLRIARDGSNVILSWPAPSTGFVLQQAPDLTSGSWVPAPEVPAVINGRNTVSQAIGAGNRMYRLRRP